MIDGVNGKTKQNKKDVSVNSCFLLDVSKWHLNSQDSLDLLWIVIIIFNRCDLKKKRLSWAARYCVWQWLGNVTATYSMLGVIQSVVKGVILFATDGRILTHYTYYHFFVVVDLLWHADMCEACTSYSQLLKERESWP